MRRGGARGVAGVADQVLMHAVSMAGRELLVIFFHRRQHGAGEAAQHSCGRDASGVLPRSQGTAVYEPCEDVREHNCKLLLAKFVFVATCFPVGTSIVLGTLLLGEHPYGAV